MPEPTDSTAEVAPARPVPRWASVPAPPRCPDDWRTGPPDFVGVGAQRCGTTWWWRGAVRQHPDVVRVGGLGKELHYFDQFWNGDVPDDFAERYHEYFPRPEGKKTGEWTPRYMHDYWSLPLLRQAAPEARILVTLRDPVDRFRSGLGRELRMAERDGREVELNELADAMNRGYYAEQMRRLFEIFPREQVLVLQLERCRDQPEAELRRTWDFLGLDQSADSPARLFEHTQPSTPNPELTDAMRSELKERYREDVHRLADLCPELDLSLWRNFAGSG
ncbi:MAG: sulfotransferase domain-containing protein [Actinomycetota bacterium]|nr:sulfotransferase domain-containing protein [Actinomycetota bacterium]